MLILQSGGDNVLLLCSRHLKEAYLKKQLTVYWCVQQLQRLVSIWVQERSKMLLRFADLVEKNADEIVALEAWDNGKSYEQATSDEIPLFIRLFHYYAGER